MVPSRLGRSGDHEDRRGRDDQAGLVNDLPITLTNNGPSDVPAGIVVTDQVPAGTTGSETEPNCTLAGTTFTCTTTAILVPDRRSSTS